jgi:transglutaminase-like putative cysteine protease
MEFRRTSRPAENAMPPVNRGHGIAYQIPRNTLALLMIAQVVVVLPFVQHLSPWLIGVGMFCGWWRFGVYQGRWDYPRFWVRALLVALSVAGVVVSGAGTFSLEAAASLLILAFGLKLIEMKNRRDAYVVIFLGYFLIATRFLFTQSLPATAYQLFAMVVVTAAMVGMNQLATRVRPLANLRLAGGLILQALPLTVVVFVFFPRIAPLWSVPMPGASATGLRESMTPGDVAELGRSDALAFRVVFEDEPPPVRDLYWRALVYSRFVDGTWSVGPDVGAHARVPSELPGAARATYEVLLEPNFSTWLVGLETALPASPGVALTSDWRLQAPEPVLGVFRYRARSYPTLATDVDLDRMMRARETWLPADDNPRIRAHATELRTATGDDRAFVAALLDEIRREPFFYTLNPPVLPRRDSIDRFWFETRRGFCTHYAGAVVFMLRAAGIPARLVGGYQGGERNPITGHVVVRQYDAHAWVEVWLQDRGWVRVDPTAAVAPARIEQGPAAALSQEDQASLSAFAGVRMGSAGAARGLLAWLDSVDHRWNLWVVGYDGDVQAGLLKRVLGDVTPLRVAIAVLTSGMVCGALVALVVFWRRRPPSRHPVERLFSGFCARAGRLGWARPGDEPPGSYLARVAQAAGQSPAQRAAAVARLNRLLYNPAAAAGRQELRELRADLRRIQFRLAFASAV